MVAYPDCEYVYSVALFPHDDKVHAPVQSHLPPNDFAEFTLRITCPHASCTSCRVRACELCALGQALCVEHKITTQCRSHSLNTCGWSVSTHQEKGHIRAHETATQNRQTWNPPRSAQRSSHLDQFLLFEVPGTSTASFGPSSITARTPRNVSLS